MTSWIIDFLTNLALFLCRKGGVCGRPCNSSAQSLSSTFPGEFCLSWDVLRSAVRLKKPQFLRSQKLCLREDSEWCNLRSCLLLRKLNCFLGFLLFSLPLVVLPTCNYFLSISALRLGWITQATVLCCLENKDKDNMMTYCLLRIYDIFLWISLTHVWSHNTLIVWWILSLCCFHFFHIFVIFLKVVMDHKLPCRSVKWRPRVVLEIFAFC